MKFNFKLNNQTFIFILIVLVLLSLLISCHNSSIIEGLPDTVTQAEGGGGVEIGDVGVAGGGGGGGVVNNVDGVVDNVNGVAEAAAARAARDAAAAAAMEARLAALAAAENDVDDYTVTTTGGQYTGPSKTSHDAIFNAANNNTTVDVEIQGTPSTSNLNPGSTTYIPQQTFSNPSLLLQQPVNSVLTTQPTGFMGTVENGFNSLFGSGSTNSTLDINNLSDLNNTSTTPSSLFTTPDGRQGIATPDNTINGIPSSQIPQGQEDLYILKSQVVPPVCPACPPVIVDKNSLSQDCPPCPPCARCPEPSFECKKVPNFNLGPQNTFLPRPVLNNFSTFGM